ncbi:Hsp20/alpha crystallin family protein [Falsiroseomonas selenitidurans]|uniref:Hsp20/alpha crystallin family protein n=1 Tax=Falsiroseomonas selenitidurans TaxID=2716335 RepID=A0ABX1EC65_9PROT|nr:Hsp20/alpha crystallin family protein [Falsiroseomonas selenitidurans]NKC34548.1 Hsp20/alpha crystallin family protein [Falsiroseomonas selenitidurans]
MSLSRAMSEQARQDAPPADPAGSLAGMLEGLKGLAEGLGRLAEGAGQAGEEGRVVFGYSVRTLDGSVQAFGHVPDPKPGGTAEAAVPEARQPLVDVFEEADAILVVAEVPGLEPAALTLALRDGALEITGAGRLRYHRRVALPCAVREAGMTHACRNGILEVRLPRAEAAP